MKSLFKMALTSYALILSQFNKVVASSPPPENALMTCDPTGYKCTALFREPLSNRKEDNNYRHGCNYYDSREWDCSYPYTSCKVKISFTTNGNKTWDEHLVYPFMVASINAFKCIDDLKDCVFVGSYPAGHQDTDSLSMLAVSRDGGRSWGHKKYGGSSPCSIMSPSWSASLKSIKNHKKNWAASGRCRSADLFKCEMIDFSVVSTDNAETWSFVSHQP